MTELRIVDEPIDEAGIRNWWSASPGDMWPCKYSDHRIEGRGPCWIVRMPGNAWVWHTNGESTSEGEGLWTVTGEAPNITVHPSINIGPEIWHGWIKNGEMTP
jgi:hypothetical protein